MAAVVAMDDQEAGGEQATGTDAADCQPPGTRANRNAQQIKRRRVRRGIGREKPITEDR